MKSLGSLVKQGPDWEEFVDNISSCKSNFIKFFFRPIFGIVSQNHVRSLIIIRKKRLVPSRPSSLQLFFFQFLFLVLPTDVYSCEEKDNVANKVGPHTIIIPLEA